MSAPMRRHKQENGRVSGSVKNALTQVGKVSNTPQAIKNAVGMKNVGGGKGKIRGTVS